MDGYVTAGYAITVGSIVLYAVRIVLRGRVLARAVGERDR